MGQVVRKLPGLGGFPSKLDKAVIDRVNTWLVPMYRFSREEELGLLAPNVMAGESFVVLLGDTGVAMQGLPL